MNNLNDEDLFDFNTEDLIGDWETSKDSQNTIINDGDTPKQEYLNVLQKSFGHCAFRPMQWKIINAVINEHRDVCAIMATGYGKSLCYQFPSVYKGGITIVISPLISLMEDQVFSLEVSNVPACLLGSAQTKQTKIVDDILEGKFTIVYATPEFCLGDNGTSILKQICDTVNIDLLAIDEAHCVSKWGHDFRPQYQNLWKLRSVIKNVPILAVTATATSEVQNDIISSLSLRNPLVLCSSFDRPNLYFEVRMKSSTQPYADFKSCMVPSSKGLCFPGSTIIYCITKKIAEDVAMNLQRNGINCVVYHAGISLKKRKEAHEQFAKDKVKVVVATIAFGMGIDKPDVRTILHYGASKDLESYYQEVGRAGRDGLPAKCITFFSAADFNIHQMLRETTTAGGVYYKRHQEDNSLLMEKYLNHQDCRRQFILNYFNEKTLFKDKPKRNCCDNCTKLLLAPQIKCNLIGIDDKGLYNLTDDAKLFLRAVSALKGSYGIQMYIFFLRGSKINKLPQYCHRFELYGKGKNQSDEWWKIIARILSAEGFLKKVFKKVDKKMSFTIVTISDKGQNFLNSKMELKIMPPDDLKKLLRLKPNQSQASNSSTSSYQSSWINLQTPLTKTQESNATITEDQTEKMYRMGLYKQLLTTRNDVAHNLDCMPYLVASNTILMNLAKLRPLTINELKSQKIDGFNDVKIQKFGQSFIDCINKYVTINPDPNKAKLEKVESNLNKTIPTNANDNNKGLVNLKQFKFVERSTQVITQTITNENSNDSFLNAACNKILDNLEDNAKKEKTEVNNENEEDTSYSWLDSPETYCSFELKENEATVVEENKSLLEDSMDSDLLQAIDNIENSLGIESSQETNVENKLKHKLNNSSEWCAKKKTKFNFLNF